MSLKQQFDTSWTKEAVCPHCGHEQSDSWEYSDSGVYNCGSCDKKFHLTRNTKVTYTTEKTAHETE